MASHHRSLQTSISDRSTTCHSDEHREARLRERLSSFDAHVQSEMRFLLDRLDQARSPGYRQIADERPAEGEDCIVLTESGRKIFVTVLHGCPTPQYPALPAGQWDDPWHGIVQWLPVR